MSSPIFKRGEEVSILDYPFGRPTNVKGEVVGILGNDHYNILIQNGCNEGKILRYKHWKLISLTRREKDDNIYV